MICGEGDAEIYVINQNLLRPFFPSLFSIQKMEELIYTTHRPRTQDWCSGDCIILLALPLAYKAILSNLHASISLSLKWG